MNKLEIKKLFWKVVNEIENCSDCMVKNDKGVVVQRGMQLEGDYSIRFGLDDGVLRIYNKENFPLIAFTEENEVLLIIKKLFEDLGIFEVAALEGPVQVQPQSITITLNSTSSDLSDYLTKCIIQYQNQMASHS